MERKLKNIKIRVGIGLRQTKKKCFCGGGMKKIEFKIVVIVLI